MEKTISVTVSLTDDGLAKVVFYEPESGDEFSIQCGINNAKEGSRFQYIVGSELSSWLSLMADEMEEDQ